MLLNYGVEKTLESPLNCKKIQPFDPKGNQSWMFIGRTDAKAETTVLWPPDVKNWLIWKDPDAGKDWRQEKKGTTEDEMVGWHHHSMDMSFGGLQELVMDRAAWCTAVYGVANSQTRLSDWNELNWTSLHQIYPSLMYPFGKFLLILWNPAQASPFRWECSPVPLC